jgi:hypothetical protein
MKRNHDDMLDDYFEGLFEHQRRVMEVYDEPILPWWAVVLMILYIIGIVWGIS